jgi:hypothetical protein
MSYLASGRTPMRQTPHSNALYRGDRMSRSSSECEQRGAGCAAAAVRSGASMMPVAA